MIEGFVDARTIKKKDRLIVGISGLNGQGKTHFSLTAPSPIATFSTDQGEEGVIEKFVDDKKIMVMYLPTINTEDDNFQSQATNAFNKFRTAYLRQLRGNEVESIVWDVADGVWSMLRLARFGGSTVATASEHFRAQQYAVVNAEYSSLVKEALAYDKNLILLHHAKEIFVNGQGTGKFTMGGFKHTGDLIQVGAWISYDSDEEEFDLEITKCRHNPFLVGEVLSGPMCCFDMLKMTVLE